MLLRGLVLPGLLCRSPGIIGNQPGATGMRWGKEDDSAFDQRVIDTVVAFIAAFFGVTLDEIDRVDLKRRLSFAVRRDNGWRVEYRSLAGFADQLARQFSGTVFTQANDDIRERVIHEIALTRRAKLRNRIHAFVSSSGRDFLRMQQSTIPHLLILYRRSGVPWRRRGYVTWPGVGGDMLAYTQAPLSGGR